MILVDNRERNSMVPGQLQKLGIELEFRNLDVGDYIIMGENPLCIERKTVEDYVGSLISERLNNELYQMSLNFPISLLVIEGFIDEALMFRKLKRQVVLSSLAGVVLKRAPAGQQGLINVLTLSTPFDTALLLYYLHQRIQEGDIVRLPKFSKIKWSPKEELEQVVSSIPGIGQLKAKNLLRHFKSLRNLFNATPEELERVEGIGKKLSERLGEFFRREYEAG